MDLVDLAILLLRIALVAVLYLFLWVVVRGALRGLRPQTAADAAPLRQPPPLVLTVLEPGESSLESGARIGVHGRWAQIKSRPARRAAAQRLGLDLIEHAIRLVRSG